jgi:hypothetical protein
VLPRTAAQVLMCPDGTFKTHTSLRHKTKSGILRLSYFRTTEQNSPGLMQFANLKSPEPPYTRKLMSPTNHHLAAAYYNDGVKILVKSGKSCKIKHRLQ